MIKKKFFKAQVFILSNYFIRKKKSLRHFCQKKKKKKDATYQVSDSQTPSITVTSKLELFCKNLLTVASQLT